MEVSILDAAFYYDAELRTRLRRVAAALLRKMATCEFTSARLTEGEIFGPWSREPSLMRDARAMAAAVALVLAEPPACALDATFVPSTLRAAREAAMFFEPAYGAETHVALAAARVCAAGTVVQLHDAARMLALMPPRYDPFAVEQYGLAIADPARIETVLDQEQRGDALWARANEQTLLEHWGSYGPIMRPLDWGARARAAVMQMYMDLHAQGRDAYHPFGVAHELPRAGDASESETCARETFKNEAPHTEDDVARELLETDIALAERLKEMRMTLLDMSRARIKHAKVPDMGYETTMDWINMLAIQHALSEALCPNQAPWNAIRDVVGGLFDKLNWYLDTPEQPPGVHGLCVLLRAETVAQFHDGARIFAGLAPQYRAPPDDSEAAREAARQALRALRDTRRDKGAAEK